MNRERSRPSMTDNTGFNRMPLPITLLSMLFAVGTRAAELFIIIIPKRRRAIGFAVVHRFIESAIIYLQFECDVREHLHMLHVRQKDVPRASATRLSGHPLLYILLTTAAFFKFFAAPTRTRIVTPYFLTGAKIEYLCT